MRIQEVKKELSLTDGDIGRAFGYKNDHSYYQSARRSKIEAGVVAIYKLAKKAGEKNIKTVDLETTKDEEAQT